MLVECDQDAAVADADGEHLDRWRICLHEAAHAVAGQVLRKHKVTAAVFDSQTGAAYQDSEGEWPRTFEEALIIAVGKVAEELAETYPPPQLPSAPPLVNSSPDAAAELLSDIKTLAIPDHVKLARWSIWQIEDQPARWASRRTWICHEATFFVRDHQQRILEVATTLHARGIVTLPAEPEKGTDHVG